MGKNTEDERFDEVLRGPTNLSGAINTAEYVAQFNIQPDDNFGPRGYDVRNIWYEENGEIGRASCRERVFPVV